MPTVEVGAADAVTRAEALLAGAVALQVLTLELCLALAPTLTSSAATSRSTARSPTPPAPADPRRAAQPAHGSTVVVTSRPVATDSSIARLIRWSCRPSASG